MPEAGLSATSIAPLSAFDSYRNSVALMCKAAEFERVASSEIEKSWQEDAKTLDAKIRDQDETIRKASQKSQERCREVSKLLNVAAERFAAIESIYSPAVTRKPLSHWAARGESLIHNATTNQPGSSDEKLQLWEKKCTEFLSGLAALSEGIKHFNTIETDLAHDPNWPEFREWKRHARAVLLAAPGTWSDQSIGTLLSWNQQAEQLHADLKRRRAELDRQIGQATTTELAQAKEVEQLAIELANRRRGLEHAKRAAFETALKFAGYTAAVGLLGGGCYGCVTRGLTTIAAGMTGALILGLGGLVLGFMGTLFFGDRVHNAEGALSQAHTEHNAATATLAAGKSAREKLEDYRDRFLALNPTKSRLPALAESSEHGGDDDDHMGDGEDAEIENANVPFLIRQNGAFIPTSPSALSAGSESLPISAPKHSHTWGIAMGVLVVGGIVLGLGYQAVHRSGGYSIRVDPVSPSTTTPTPNQGGQPRQAVAPKPPIAVTGSLPLPLDLADVVSVDSDQAAWDILRSAESRGRSQRNVAREANNRGFRLLNTDHEPERALPFFEYSSRLDPKYGMPRYNAAKCLVNRQDLDGALRYLDEIKRLGRGQHERLATAQTDPAFAPLRSDPRFTALFQ